MSVDFYEQILGSLTSGVIVVDSEARIVVANPAACVHLGGTRESLVPGGPVAEATGSPVFMELFEEIRTTGRGISRREIFVGENDDARSLGVTASPLQGAHAFNGAIFLFTDLTEIHSLRKAAELNRQLAQIGELTAGVVHELRNPLSVISGMAELLIRKLGDAHEQQSKAKAILVEAAQLEKLINQFLSFARPFDVECAPTASGDIVLRAVDLCERLATEKSVHLETHCGEGLPPVRADHEKLSLALGNIVRNAVEVVDEGGMVTISTRMEQGGHCFRIEDNGPGIHLKKGQDLFDPFVSNKQGGTGLGLSIVHRIVTAHGGKVYYGNRPEGGAYFEVRIPESAGTSAS